MSDTEKKDRGGVPRTSTSSTGKGESHHTAIASVMVALVNKPYLEWARAQG